MNIDNLKNKISNDLDIIMNNKDFLKIMVTDADIKNVENVLTSNDINLLNECSYEMDDIINGIIISIDEELNRLSNIKTDDLNMRKEILNKIMDISSRLRFFPDNKNYFLSKIKVIYTNIDGDEL